MAHTTQSLGREVDLYGEFSDSWRRDQGGAMECCDFERVVAWSLFVFDRIRRIDEEWSGELLGAGREPSEADARAMYDIYANWNRTARITGQV